MNPAPLMAPGKGTGISMERWGTRRFLAWARSRQYSAPGIGWRCVHFPASLSSTRIPMVATRFSRAKRRSPNPAHRGRPLDANRRIPASPGGIPRSAANRDCNDEGARENLWTSHLPGDRRLARFPRSPRLTSSIQDPTSPDRTLHRSPRRRTQRRRPRSRVDHGERVTQLGIQRIEIPRTTRFGPPKRAGHRPRVPARARCTGHLAS